jgi:hypothetical protein
MEEKMLIKRIGSKFRRKKSNSTVVVLVIISILSAVVLCTSCTPDVEKEINNITYSNNDLGFELSFPEDWDGKYFIEESDKSICVYSKKIKENTGLPGLLFSIVRLTGELITEEDIAQSPSPERIIQKGNGYTFILRIPSDVQYPPDNEEMFDEYKSMEKDVRTIAESILLIDNNIPDASNDGFKVVGSSFFTAEIPDSWLVEPVEGVAMTWDIKENDHYVGQIRFLPYFTDTDSEEFEIDGYLFAYLSDEELLRKVEINLKDRYADKTVLDKITGSFEFIGGSFTSVDMETAAQQYIRAGGKKIFGKIEGVLFEEENPVSILIKEMEFFLDDNAPNGFRIETLSELPVEYPVGRINVLPLAPPSFINYGTYYMPPIKDFIEKYDYEYYCYDFILGADGEIKMILGKYIP